MLPCPHGLPGARDILPFHTPGTAPLFSARDATDPKLRSVCARFRAFANATTFWTACGKWRDAAFEAVWGVQEARSLRRLTYSPPHPWQHFSAQNVAIFGRLWPGFLRFNAMKCCFMPLYAHAGGGIWGNVAMLPCLGGATCNIFAPPRAGVTAASRVRQKDA